MYRVSLPVPIGGNQEQAGRWHAVITNPGRPVLAALAFASGQRSARYSLSIQTYSNLRLRASLAQSGNEPGATIYLRAALTEYAVPLPSPARVRAEIVQPDGTHATLTFTPSGAGAYEASVPAVQASVYRFRIIAEGMTMRGRPFTREQTRTGAVWPGGDQPPPRPNDPGQQFCHFVHCLLDQKGFLEILNRKGIDPARIRRCLDEICGRGAGEHDRAAQLRDLLQNDRAVGIIADALRHLEVHE